MWDEATTVISSDSRSRRQDLGFLSSLFQFRFYLNNLNSIHSLTLFILIINSIYGIVRYALFLTQYPSITCPHLRKACTGSNRAVCLQTSSSNESAAFTSIPHLLTRTSCPKLIWLELHKCYDSFFINKKKRTKLCEQQDSSSLMRWLLLPIFRELSDISGLPLQVPTSPETPGLNFVRGGLLFYTMVKHQRQAS
jgi:hypothetical protein